MSEPRYGMTVDVKRCVGCHACTLACKAENDLPEDGFRCWIRTETRGEFPNLSQEIRSERCLHCSDAPCVSCCPTGASHVSAGGTVQVTPEMCTGCKACIAACPYDVRYIHTDGYADKCTFCMHRVREGKKPACVTVCPTHALVFGDLNNRDSVISRLMRKRQHKTLKPEAGTSPNLFFLT